MWRTVRCAIQPTGPRGTRSAFTLVELVIVIAVMALLSATAASKYSSALSNFGVDALARRVAADLAYAQSIARRSGSAQAVTFDTVNNQYQLVGLTDPDHPGTSYIVSTKAEPYRGSLASLALTVGAATVTQINFDKYGFPDAGGNIVVQVGSVQKTVTLNATSGKTTIQ